MDAGDRQEIPLRRRRPRPGAPRRPAPDLHHLRHRQVRHAPTISPAPRSPPSTCPPRSGCSERSASYDAINMLSKPGRTRRPSSGHRPSPAPGGRGGHRSDRRQRADQLDQSGTVVLLDCPAGLRVHLPVRRRVHHLQHLLDPGGAAHPGAGPASHRRSEPPPGVPFGPPRSRHARGGGIAWSASASGVLSAIGLEALLKGFGVTLPTGPLVFETRTVIVALVVGVGVTVVSAISPARRAVRIPPVAAIVDHQGEREESSRRRILIGTIIAVLGSSPLAFGLTKPAIQLVGLGAVGWLHRDRHAGTRWWPDPCRASSADRWHRSSGCPASWDARTRCAVRAGPPRPRQP